ncbi:hypothetical protein [Sphingobium sp. B2D3C]|uniref:hypothetical protein n=3 Tax=Sphingobium TaxID=165695 RepID=UPI0022249902|nr:hypothetical protein [Sphingobium sp. B2D3C]MCW2383520.1 hypothetical protein [Sphingobium sp. B2D3B]MCW2399505.1 hypothetical protein [Sphingobium sp. B2D3C]
MKGDNQMWGQRDRLKPKAMMKRASGWFALLPVVLVAFWVAVSWPGWQREADQAAGLAARLGCSCRYVENRPLESCQSDLAGVPWMALVRYEDAPEARRLTAKIPMLATRSARLKPGFGCMPER